MNQDLKKTLRAAADKLRAGMDAAEYPDSGLSVVSGERQERRGGGGRQAGPRRQGRGAVHRRAQARVDGDARDPRATAFTFKGTIGRFAYVDADTAPTVYSSPVCFWRSVDRDALERAYLHFWMRSPAFSRQVDVVRGQAAIMDFISLSDRRRMPLDLPPIRLQKQFGEVTEPMLNRISSNRCQATMLSSMRDNLLPRLISGKPCLPAAQERVEDALA